MPVCETCNSVVKKDDVKYDEAHDRTTCPRCQSVGPVRNEDYALSLTLTNQGVAVAGRAPGLELTYADTWPDIKQRLAAMRREESPAAVPASVQPIKLVAHSEE